MSNPKPKSLKPGNKCVKKSLLSGITHEIAAGAFLLCVLSLVVIAAYFWPVTTPPIQTDSEIRLDVLQVVDALIKSDKPQEKPQEPQESPEAPQGDLSTPDAPTPAPAAPVLLLPPPDAIEVQVEVQVEEPAQPAPCQNRCYQPQKSPETLQDDLSNLDSSTLAPGWVEESVQPVPCQNRCYRRRCWFRR